MKISKQVTSSRSINYFKTLEERLNKVHNSYYDYSNSVYISIRTKIEIICPEHGVFYQTVHDHLNGHGCSRCASARITENSRMSEEDFLSKVSEIYIGREYDYSKVDFSSITSNKDRVEVICPLHGSFLTQINNHLREKAKCPNCAKVDQSTNLWSYTAWEDAGISSKNFEGFKLYLIECWDSTTKERFLKVGKTFTSIGKRFASKTLMPYEFKVLKVLEGSGRYISELEAKLKKDYGRMQYTPAVLFAGKHECINLEEKESILSKME